MKEEDRLQVGDVIEITEGAKIWADLPEHFIYSNRRGVFDKTVSQAIIVKDQWDYFAGEYIVHKAQMEGGGSDHGHANAYPKYWQVYLERPEDGKQIEIIQDGPIPVIRKAKRTWK